MNLSAKEIVEYGFTTSRQDFAAVVASKINRQPARLREKLVQGVEEILRAHYLSDGPYGGLSAPKLFSYEQATKLWESFLCMAEQHHKMEHSSAFIDELETYLKPREESMQPLAYSGRWTPSSWNVPLTPLEVRSGLGMTDIEVFRIIKFVEDCCRRVGKDHLRVAVIPYADTLPVAAALYAVSDQTERLTFEVASFYEKPRTWDGAEPKFVLSPEGSFDIGYATEFQLGEPRFSEARESFRVFEAPFTRSVLLKVWKAEENNAPQYGVLSFVGQFATETFRKFSRLGQKASYKVLLANSPLKDLTVRLDPSVDWEQELILLLLSNTCINLKRDGLATFVSTDVHSWLTYSGLLPEAHRPADIVPRFEIASWFPEQRSNNPDPLESDAVDLRSNLCYFFPVGARDPEARVLRSFPNRIMLKAEELYSESVESELGLSTLRQKACIMAQCLLAPLLKAHPWYRGALLSVPPDQWLIKLTGPDAHIKHVPYWQHLDSRRQESGGRVASSVMSAVNSEPNTSAKELETP